MGDISGENIQFDFKLCRFYKNLIIEWLEHQSQTNTIGRETESGIDASNNSINFNNTV